MKHTFLIVCSLLLIISASRAQISIDTQYISAVKSIQLSPYGSKLDPPLLRLGTDDRLEIAFDMLADEPEEYRYEIRHCDQHFVEDGLTTQEYMSGFNEGAIGEHQFSLTTLQNYIHYRQTLPDEISEFTASGNYVLKVYRAEAPDEVLFTRRFRVAEDLFGVEMEAVTPSEAPNENQEIAVALTPKTGTDHQWSNTQYLFPYLQQNGRTDIARLLPFGSYQGNKLLYRFKKENIFTGGNCFRFFDFSNLRTPMYNVQNVERFGGETFVMLRPCEDLSRKNYNYIEGLMGGFKINIWDRTQKEIEADYAWVNITLPMERPYLDGTVHVVGDLTQWNLGDTSRMEWNPKFKAYVKRMYLKQGYYSYQLLFLPVGSHEGETARIEGNHYETPNTYTLYLYGRRPTDLYDRLIAVKKMKR